MKFGFRTPSFKRSLSAATKGAAKRALMREIVPYYGKRGMGWSNPKKAAYNHLYNMTTANPIDLVLDAPKQERYQQLSQTICEENVRCWNVRERGLLQCEVPMALFKYIINELQCETPMHKAIKRLEYYSRGFLNKPVSYGLDYCDMCEERLAKQRINEQARVVCLEIVGYIRQGKNAEDIFSRIAHYSGKVYVLHSIWATEYKGKTYALEFDYDTSASTYEIDSLTNNRLDNSSYGIGYAVSGKDISFRGSFRFGEPCNPIGATLSDDKLMLTIEVLSERQEWENRTVEFRRLERKPIAKIVEPKKTTPQVIHPKTTNAQVKKKQEDLPIWQRVLFGIGVIVGIFLVIWIIAEFVFPAILLGLIFISFLFSKW